MKITCLLVSKSWRQRCRINVCIKLVPHLKLLPCGNDHTRLPRLRHNFLRLQFQRLQQVLPPCVIFWCLNCGGAQEARKTIWSAIAVGCAGLFVLIFSEWLD